MSNTTVKNLALNEEQVRLLKEALDDYLNDQEKLYQREGYEVSEEVRKYWGTLTAIHAQLSN